MTEPPAPRASSDPQIRALRRDLVFARDEQIRRVVAMVDAMPARGPADALIAPLRPRLAQLRPRRPVNFGRLLFTPLNPVIVPGGKWRRGALAVPRTALPPMIEQVRQALPELDARLAEQLAGVAVHEHARIRPAGAMLWPQAARVLADAPMPPDWDAATGLPAADHRSICRMVAAVLAEATTIEELAALGSADEAAVEPMLQRAAAAGGEVLGALITVLLARLPGAARYIALANNLPLATPGTSGRALADRAIDMVLDNLQATAPTDVATPIVLDDLRRAVGLLDDLEEQFRDRPSRAARVTTARQQIDTACRTRFDDTLQAEVMARLDSVPGTEPADVDSLESAARELRRFEAIARRLNGSDHYDRALRRTATLLAPRQEDSTVSRIDRLRLTEILLGPEQAMAQLAALPPPMVRYL